jgi:hypothetical protein
MTPEVTKTVSNKIILNVWIENGPVLFVCYYASLRDAMFLRIILAQYYKFQ